VSSIECESRGVVSLIYLTIPEINILICNTLQIIGGSTGIK